MGSFPVVLLLCSFHGNAAKQNTQIILFNYGWVAVCLFLCCETLPSCGFCSTAFTAVAQTQQDGKRSSTHKSHFRIRTSYVAWHLSICESLQDVFPIWLCFLSLILEATVPPGGTLPDSEWQQIGNDLWTASRKAPRTAGTPLFVRSILSLVHFQCVMYLLSLQTVGRRCILAPGCTRFTGPSRDVLVVFASTGDLQWIS